ncbi:MAG: hypothetical protein NC416_00235 [Eubacterium sp.]|nr:hypothetical protein [Eubacterium sp.]
MDIYERIIENRTKIESIYDIASICYDHLCIQVNNQALFLAKYIEYSEEAVDNNPNIRKLKKFSYDLSVLFLKKDTYFTLDEVVEQVLQAVRCIEKELIYYGNEKDNEATIAYHLLQAVDLYTENRVPDSSNAPLNEKYTETSYIYRTNGEAMITGAATELEFRDKIQTTEIRHNFKCIRILEKAELAAGMNPPKMVTLHIENSDQIRELIARDKKWKVAVIPFGRDELFRFKKIQGSMFRVQYIEQHRQNAIMKAVNLLKQAIQQKANIIIFPEYVCFPEMQEAIGDYLTETYRKAPKSVQNLLLVIAGSGWTEENNNVARIYSYSGKLLGEQYKYSPYDGEDEYGERWIEGLSNPGRESVIINIPSIGSIMTAICRDVSNRDQTEKLADIFRIDFLLVVAWSKSLHGGFDKQLGSITEMNMTTSSIVCNCCGAMDRDSRDRGIVVTPHKKKSIIEAKVRLFKRNAGGCENCAGCIFSIPLLYRTQDVDRGKIVGRIAQRKL